MNYLLCSKIDGIRHYQFSCSAWKNRLRQTLWFSTGFRSKRGQNWIKMIVNAIFDTSGCLVRKLIAAFLRKMPMGLALFIWDQLPFRTRSEYSYFWTLQRYNPVGSLITLQQIYTYQYRFTYGYALRVLKTTSERFGPRIKAIIEINWKYIR